MLRAIALVGEQLPDVHVAELDAYLRYYNEERTKESLGWLSPAQYRASLGLVA